MVDKMRDQIDNRSLYLRNQSAATPWNFWAQTLYAHSRQSSGTYTPGYQTNGYGINVGVDRRFNDESLFGVSLGYQNANINIHSYGNEKMSIAMNLWLIPAGLMIVTSSMVT